LLRLGHCEPVAGDDGHAVGIPEEARDVLGPAGAETGPPYGGRSLHPLAANVAAGGEPHRVPWEFPLWLIWQCPRGHTLGV
jgi:hypothetical protein